MKDLEVLLSGYLKGNNQSVAQLYDRLKNRLLLLAYNYCRDKEMSRDIVQDIFEKLLLVPVEKRKEYFDRPGTNIEAYLAVVVKNRCLDTYKINHNREKILQDVRYPFDTSIENSSLEIFFIDGLKEMLNNLQPREQQIIQLHLDGYTNEEIATNLNITYNTVKNNIYESKKKLRNLWDLFMT